MPDTIKKRIGICLRIMFGISLIICLLNQINSFTYINYLYLLSDIIYIAPILYIAFNKQSGSNVWSKTGGGLYIALLLMFASQQVAILAKGTPLIEFGLLWWIIPSASYLFLLMFYWGTRIWLPIKIVITTNVIPDIVSIIAYSKLIHAQGSDYQIWEEAIESYTSTVDLIRILNTIIYAISLILAIVWLSDRSKKVSTPANVSQQAIKEPNQVNKPELINKIPHK